MIQVPCRARPPAHGQRECSWVQPGERRTSLTKRQQQAIETRKKLLDTAMRLISERGFDAVSVSDITSECGVASGTFYLYFKSKDELILYLSNRIHDDLRALIADFNGSSYLELLKTILLKWKAWYEEEDPKLIVHTNILYANMYIRGDQHPRKNDPGFEEETFHLCLKKAVENGELHAETPVAFYATLLSIEIHGMIPFYSHKHPQEEIDAWWTGYLDTVFDRLLGPYKQK